MEVCPKKITRKIKKSASASISKWKKKQKLNRNWEHLAGLELSTYADVL